jgi:hypothetical protein
MRKKAKKMNTETSTNMEGILSRSFNQTANNIKPKKEDKGEISRIIEGDSLELIDAPSGKIPKKSIMCKWKDIKGPSYYTEIPPSEWGNKKFFTYFRNLCGKKNDAFKDSIDEKIAIARQASFTARIKEEFLKKLDKPATGEMLKEYIEWFVGYELDEILKRADFNVYDICSKKYISDFISQHDNKKSVVEERIDTGDIEKTFNSGGINFLISYGLVVAFVWLTKKKSFTPTASRDVVLRYFKESQRAGKAMADRICSRTISLGPYPPDYFDKHLDELLKTCNVKGVSFTGPGKNYV